MSSITSVASNVASIGLLKSFFQVADQNSDGSIEVGEVKETERLVRTAQVSLGDMSVQIKTKQIMEELDRNDDGIVDEEEQRLAIADILVRRGGTIQDLEKEYDFNGNSVLDLNEIVELRLDLDKKRELALARARGEEGSEKAFSEKQATTLGQATLILGRYAQSLGAASSVNAATLINSGSV